MQNHDVILVAEDDENHALLLRRALKQSGCLNPVFFVQDGEEVITYLDGKGKFSNRIEYPLPSLLLLDLKMPNKNGFEVLAWLRAHPTLNLLPVVVLTGSDESGDIKQAYQLGANSFLTKPVDIRDFIQMCAAIKGYWLWLSRVPELARPGEPGSAGPELALVGDRRASGHFVQFYESDTFLVDSASAYIGPALWAGEAAIIIATEGHREAVAARLLRQDKLDVATLSARGQYVASDADETLSKFMVAGAPDAKLFQQAVGTVVTRAAQAGRRVRVFSELTALLWAEGNGAAAIRLEELWNELGKDLSFSLFCACPISGFGGHSNRAAFLEICDQHARVLPTESYSGLASEEQRLRSITMLQQKALDTDKQAQATIVVPQSSKETK